MSAGAVRWSCARCGVSVGRIDGEPTDLPETWTAAERETFCLTCSRARAGEVALALTEGESSREDRVRIQRDAVIEFVGNALLFAQQSCLLQPGQRLVSRYAHKKRFGIPWEICSTRPRYDYPDFTLNPERPGHE